MLALDKTRHDEELGGNVRREDNGLADHLACGASGDIDSVASGAGGTSNELVLVGRGPAAMADVGLLDLARIRVRGVSSNHAEALKAVNNRAQIIEVGGEAKDQPS